MNINWKFFKAALAGVVIVGAIFWAVGSVLPHSYIGTNLDIDLGSGPVTVTNPSDQPVPVQLVGAGTRSFTVSSTIEGVSGASTRQGSGSTSTQLLEFELPSGVNEFAILRGANVNLVVNSQTRLEATVQPMNTSEVNTTLIAAAVIVFGSLFYISHTFEHRWIGVLRGKKAVTPDLTPVVETAASRQGRTTRSYGDNRADV